MSMTKDLKQKIHDDSNSQDESCQKLGEIFWDRYDGLKPMPPVTVNSQLKTETGQLTSPTVSQVHGYPGYCPRLPPMSDQCYGTQQISLVQTHTSSDRQDMAHPTTIDRSFQKCKTKSQRYQQRWLIRPMRWYSEIIFGT